MSIEESDILKKANLGAEASDIGQAVEVLAQVMQMVCDRDRDVEHLGTDYRNQHTETSGAYPYLRKCLNLGESNNRNMHYSVAFLSRRTV